MDVWVERELAGCEFPDQRLEARLGKLLTDLGRKIGSTPPKACQDWAATKAAYRLFDNNRIDESTILSGQFAATQLRIAATKGPILIVHDTTEFSFQRERLAQFSLDAVQFADERERRLGAQPIARAGLEKLPSRVGPAGDFDDPGAGSEMECVVTGEGVGL